MVSVARSRFFRRCLALICLGAALIFGCYGVLLLVDAFDPHGSPGGNVLLFALGLVLLVPSLVVFIAALNYWRRLSHLSTDDTDN
jgi:hypothetical protein